MLAAEHPVWLWLALAFATSGIITSVFHRSRSRRWLLAGLLLPAASATAIALALANITFSARPRILILLDFSPSTRQSPWHDPAWLHALAQRRLSPTQPLTVIAFAGKLQHTLLQDLTPQDSWPAQFDWDVSPDARTDLPAALAATAGPHAARWIITDGLFPPTAIPPNNHAAWTILPPAAPDAAVRDILLRPAADGQVGILVQLRVTGIANTATARVTIDRDSTSIADQSVEFHPPRPGADAVRWFTLKDHPPNTAPHHYTATIQLPNDPWPENDRGTATWAATGELRTLIVGNQRPIGLPGDFLPTDRFPPSAAQLAAEGWQLIVLNDIPAEPQAGAPALAPASARALDQFVRDNGGGLILLAGTHAFGPGRYGEGSVTGDLLETLSPVSSHPKQTSGLAVLFLLDASSSMNERAPGTNERKIAILSRGVQEAAAYLADQDELTLVTFASNSRLLAHGEARHVLPNLGPSLATLEPAGTTNPDSALPQVAEFMKSTSRHLVVLLTDGEIPSMDIAQWKTLLQSPTTHLAIIAPPFATGALQQLAAALPDASWSQTDNPGAWAAALRQAVLAQARGNVETTPLPWTAAPDLTATATTWTHTWIKPESTALATSNAPAAVPVAAVAQRGLGKVAALAIADDGTPNYQTLRQRLVQSVAAGPGDRRFTAAAQRTEGGWLISADGIAEGKFLDGQSLSVKILDSGESAPLPQTAPGHYQTCIPSGATGLAAVIVRPDASGQLVARVQAAAVETTEWPATVETAIPPPGTTVLPVGEGPQWTPPTTTISLSPWLWLFAALAALSAVWARK